MKTRNEANINILRGVCLFVASPAVAIAVGVWLGSGIWSGILWGILGFIAALCGAVALGTSENRGTVTALDCVLPIIISIFCGIIFAPVHLFAANFFSSVTCIGSGLLFSLALIMFRSNRLDETPLWIVGMVFLYEILPINLPTDLDDVLCLGGQATTLFLKASIKGIASGALLKGKSIKAIDCIREMESPSAENTDAQQDTDEI